MEAVESVRTQFRPQRITTLFVGESAPASGDFFYYGNTGMTRYMKRAIDSALGDSSTEFLERFKSMGWYLDDLVLTPVNALSKQERSAKCLGAKHSLCDRIAEYQPLAIVTLMIGIKDIVEAAAVEAGSDAPRFAVRFPGMGQQNRFLADMANLIPRLPKV